MTDGVMTGGPRVGTVDSEAGLYRLMTWLSPSFPVGAFSYSHGLEQVVEAGERDGKARFDVESFTAWLATLLRFGSGRSDAIFFRHAYEAANDEAALYDIAELAAAFAASAERQLETLAQGNAFFEATKNAWPCAALQRLRTTWPGPLAYPVVVAVAAAGHGIALRPALQAYLHGFSGNLVSAGVRLIPLGQSDGQRVIAALEGPVADCLAMALTTSLDDLGGAALLADLAAVKHETQYTRLFRS